MNSPVIAIDQRATIDRLRQSLETIEWAASLVPARWTHALPDFYPPDSWTVAMNLAHLVVYEEEVALPVLRSIATGGDGSGVTRPDLPTWFEPDATASAERPLAELLARYRAARVQQIAVAEACESGRWDELVCMNWNTGRHGTPPHSAAWVASKTFQHSWEHGNAILRMALFAPA